MDVHQTRNRATTVGPFTFERARRLIRSLLALLILIGAGQMMGCEIDSFFDPSKTGRFEFSATTIPILERIAVIEQGMTFWANATAVTSEDLIPNDLSYRLVPGDVVTIEAFEVYQQGVWTTVTRRVESSGDMRFTELGDVPAAGLTAQELEDHIVQLLREQVMANPLVNVFIEEGQGFRYTIYGAIQPGVFTLRDPNLRLLDALAIAGGVPLTTQHIYVIREIELTDDVSPRWERSQPPAAGTPDRQPDESPVDIEDLIRQLDREDGGVSPGVLRQDGEPMIDIDELEPVKTGQKSAVDMEDVQEIPLAQPGAPGGEGQYIYIPEKDAWVRVKGEGGPGDVELPPGLAPRHEMVLERVIDIQYQALSHGDSSYNIVIRPNDRIYVETTAQGVVYIDGEILRPGVYNLPQVGRLTLSRLVAAAGGPSVLAIPERVDITRVVAPQREATVRLNLAAIRNRTEPDIYLKPDDHIIMGTNVMAVPLAVFRNGFRMTYGFGFLLDRNFGNDVFGAPPSNFR